MQEKLVEIITIGDELLIGQTIDTNSAFIATLLNLNGISVKQISSVSDNAQHITNALNEAQNRADIILLTGGLGPTKDDITKKTLCQYFNCAMRFDEEAYQNVERLFATLGRTVTPINRQQAEVPEICETIQNQFGTAPGMWFDVNDKIIMSMPGVPYEMKAMMQNSVLPRLKNKFDLPHIFHKTVLTQGVGESFLADIISEWENSLSKENIKLAYLPSVDMVRLRLSTKGSDMDTLKLNVNKKIAELQLLIPQYICGYETYGEEKETLEQLVGNLLKQSNKTLATAESCTGGYLAHLITKVPGSSDYYVGSVISYANKIKESELGISPETLQQHGAVSKTVVEQMAQAVLKKFNTDYAIATSGIAGPSGGTDEKPVGTVWIAIASKEDVTAEKFLFGKNRERNIQKTATSALNMLRKKITMPVSNHEKAQ